MGKGFTRIARMGREFGERKRRATRMVDGRWRMGAPKLKRCERNRREGEPRNTRKTRKRGTRSGGTLNLELRTLNLEQRNAGNLQPSTFNLQPSTETGP